MQKLPKAKRRTVHCSFRLTPSEARQVKALREKGETMSQCARRGLRTWVRLSGYYPPPSIAARPTVSTVAESPQHDITFSLR